MLIRVHALRTTHIMTRSFANAIRDTLYAKCHLPSVAPSSTRRLSGAGRFRLSGWRTTTMSAPDRMSVVAVRVSQLMARSRQSPHSAGTSVPTLPSLVFHASSPGVTRSGLLGHFVPLQGGDAQTLHHRITVLDAVAQRTGGGVHDDTLQRHAHVVDENDECLERLTSMGCGCSTRWPWARAAATIVR